ncbi:MAG: hypothetical protein Q7V05_10435 [Methanoregula sp.]|nr:hypothetical protein [Methanoregula sp.]
MDLDHFVKKGVSPILHSIPGNPVVHPPSAPIRRAAASERWWRRAGDASG